MGVAAPLAPKGLGSQNPTKKLAYWVELLGQPLSQNNVVKNLEHEPPPPNHSVTLECIQDATSYRE